MKFRNGAPPGGLADALTDGGGATMVFGATAGTMVAVGGAGASYAYSGCSSNIVPATYPPGDTTGTGQISITASTPAASQTVQTRTRASAKALRASSYAAVSAEPGSPIAEQGSLGIGLRQPSGGLGVWAKALLDARSFIL